MNRPHNSPSWVNYRVHVVSILNNTDRVKTEPYWTTLMINRTDTFISESRFKVSADSNRSLKTKDRQFDYFVVTDDTDDTVSCHNDNLRCHQWWQNCHIDDFVSENIAHCVIDCLNHSLTPFKNRLHFQMQFHEQKFPYFVISLNFVPNGPI